MRRDGGARGPAVDVVASERSGRRRGQTAPAAGCASCWTTVDGRARALSRSASRATKARSRGGPATSAHRRREASRGRTRPAGPARPARLRARGAQDRASRSGSSRREHRAGAGPRPRRPGAGRVAARAAGPRPVRRAPRPQRWRPRHDHPWRHRGPGPLRRRRRGRRAPRGPRRGGAPATGSPRSRGRRYPPAGAAAEPLQSRCGAAAEGRGAQSATSTSPSPPVGLPARLDGDRGEPPGVTGTSSSRTTSHPLPRTNTQVSSPWSSRCRAGRPRRARTAPPGGPPGRAGRAAR